MMPPSKLPVLFMIFLMFVGALTCFSADAFAEKKHKKKAVQHRESTHPANASILIDADTGMVISQNDADRALYPASLTKLMTLLLTFDALASGKISLQSRVVMTSHAASMPPSKLGIRPGQSITVDSAIKALVTKSANDVAVALGETLGGSAGRFAQMMNLKARELGMTQTHFVNACGLHNVRQTSSARDMSKLALHIIKTYPNRYPVFATRDFYFNGKSYHNHNRLMSSYQGMDGMKTGYIVPSGFNLVASAKRNNVRLIGVVFGGRTANSRNAQMAEMLDKGFEKIGDLRRKNPQIVQLKPQQSSQQRPQPAERKTLVEPSPLPTLPSVQTTITTKAQRAQPPILKPYNPDSAILSPSPNLTAKVANPPVPAQTQPAEGWAIQIGAFQDRVSTDQAIYNAIQKLPAPLNRGSGLVIPLRTAEATWVFRARIGGYTKEQAMQACRYLDNCLTISPSTH